MEKSTFINFLNDTLKNIIDRAINKVDSNKDEFQKGVQFGYYEAISHFMNQADTFFILDQLDEYLKDFNPDDLLNGKAKSPFERESSEDEIEECS